MKKALSVFLCVILSAFVFSVPASADNLLPVVVVGGETAEYTVNYYISSSSSSGVILYDSVKRTGEIGQPATYEKLSFFGFTERSVTGKTVSADGSTKLTVIYDADTSLPCGDVNADRAVDMLDLALLERLVARWQGYDASTVDIYTADTNNSGTVDVADAVLLAKYLAGNSKKLKTVAEQESEWSPWA